VWVRWVALGRRFLPSQIMDEPLNMLDDIIQIDNLYKALTKPETPENEYND
jgi:hypothetical protein